MAQFEREKEQQKHQEQDTRDEATEVPGFDALAGNTWIYPTNYPIRQYQVTGKT